MSTEQISSSDAAIVGFGPVGAVLAALLARRGWSVTVFDRDTEIFALPRAAHLDHEVMRILQETGCADEVLRDMRENVGMDFLSAEREVLLSFRSPGVTAGGWPASLLFHQPGFEKTLRSTVHDLGVATRLGAEVTAIDTARDDCVTLTLADGTRHESRWLIGCDGARSFVRRALGVAMHDLEFEEPWLVVDLILHEPVAALPDRALQVCDPARPHTLVPMPSPRVRFEFMLLAGEDAEAMQDPGVVRSLVARWVDPALVDVERSAVYTFHGLVAREWRQRRVFLAGDAAHQMPPFLGQGMCSGIRDAANLAWKLDLVERCGAPDSLLDSYQAEREPHVRAIVEAAVGFGRLICTTDTAEAAARDAQFLGAPVGTSETPSAIPALRGPLVAGVAHPLVPQPVLDGVRLDDLVGTRFALVTRERSDEAAFAAPHVLLDAHSHPQFGAWLDLVGADAVIVRPDRHLLSAGDDLTALIAAANRALFASSSQPR